jgi:DNA-binding XRE family transcriptional regulator
MKSRNAKVTPGSAKRQTVNGRRVVILSEKEYERLLQEADLWEPILPEPNADGYYPAREYMLTSLALKIIRHRRRAGLTQVELAHRAGLRPETLNRIEQGKLSPSVATVEKIERALRQAEKRRKSKYRNAL